MGSTCIRHVTDAKEKELLLGTLIRIAPLSDNKLKDAQKLLGTSTIGPHPARPAPAIAPHDSPTSADDCGSAIGRAIPSLAAGKDSTGALRENTSLMANTPYGPIANLATANLIPIETMAVSFARQGRTRLSTAVFSRSRTCRRRTLMPAPPVAARWRAT